MVNTNKIRYKIKQERDRQVISQERIRLLSLAILPESH